jgi:RNA polymerase sigma-70 factor, ECF subfamily
MGQAGPTNVFMKPTVALRTGFFGAAERRATRTVPSFDEVYEAHFAFVWRVLRHLGVPPAQLDDAAQEVFIVVHRRLPEFEGRAATTTWLFTIARRVARDQRVRAARHAPSALAPDPAPPVEGPHEQLARHEAAVEVERFLAELDDDKREVFVLAELEQLPAPAIAEALGVNVNTVYSRLRAARERFEQLLVRRRARERSES